MTLRIGLRHIRCFEALVNTGSFSKAALSLHTVQPTLSRYIKELEGILDVQLICRDTRPIQLTKAGESFKTCTAPILQSLDVAVKKVHGISKGYNGILRIARSDDVNIVVLSDVLGEFRECFPEVEVQFFSVDFSTQVQGLQKGLFDAGFCRYPVETPEIIKHQVYQEDLSVVLPKRHTLLNYNTIDLDKFLSEPLIFYHPEELKGSYQQIFHKFGVSKIKPNIVQSANTFEFMLSLVGAGFGVSMMGNSRIAMAKHANVAIRPFSHRFTLDTYLLHPAKISLPLKKFIEKINLLKNSINTTQLT